MERQCHGSGVAVSNLSKWETAPVNAMLALHDVSKASAVVDIEGLRLQHGQVRLSARRLLANELSCEFKVQFMATFVSAATERCRAFYMPVAAL